MKLRLYIILLVWIEAGRIIFARIKLQQLLQVYLVRLFDVVGKCDRQA